MGSVLVVAAGQVDIVQGDVIVQGPQSRALGRGWGKHGCPITGAPESLSCTSPREQGGNPAAPQAVL